jgi:hypothetical protein
MKTKLSLLFVALALPAAASITLSTQFGTAFNSSGVAVPDGTLWALVVDTNTDSQFTGFGLNGSLPSTVVADTYFTANQALSIGGVLNGNTIFAFGAFNGGGDLAGGAISALSFDYGVNGLAAGRNYAFYWFPGANFNAGTPLTQTIGTQVGGIHTSSNDGLFDVGMVLPPDGAAVSTGAATEAGGGTIANSGFRAVNLTVIPEPSAALLGAIGALGLLRRRRN